MPARKTTVVLATSPRIVDRYVITIPPSEGTSYVEVIRFAPESAQAALKLDRSGYRTYMGADGSLLFLALSSDASSAAPHGLAAFPAEGQ